MDNILSYMFCIIRIQKMKPGNSVAEKRILKCEYCPKQLEPLLIDIEEKKCDTSFLLRRCLRSSGIRVSTNRVLNAVAWLLELLFINEDIIVCSVNDAASRSDMSSDCRINGR